MFCDCVDISVCVCWVFVVFVVFVWCVIVNVVKFIVVIVVVVNFFMYKIFFIKVKVSF